MNEILMIVDPIRRWIWAARWHSWLAHGAFGFLLAVVFGPTTAIVAYGLKEADEVAAAIGRAPIDWTDHAGDFLGPVVGAIAAALL